MMPPHSIILQLYQDFIQEHNIMIAASFPYTFIHLYSTSLFLLDYFLEIEEINLFEINKDVIKVPVAR